MADVKFSALPAVTSVTGAEILAVAQGGVSRRATVAQIVAGVQATADAALSRSGGTMTGPITLIADPTAPMQAATRQYVDSKIGSGGANIPGFDANYPGAFRGRVNVDLWPNVTRGSGITQAQRQANLIALHAARDYAINNGMELVFGGARYEFEGAGGFTIPPINGFRVTWLPSAQMVQFSDNTPVITVAEVSNPASSSYAANIHLLGFPRLMYGVSQDGKTNANAFACGGAWRCHFQIDVEAVWNGDGWNNAPYMCFSASTQNASNAFFFENTVEGTFQGAQRTIFHIRSVGTGNRFPRLYLTNGIGGNPKPLSNCALHLSEGQRLDDNHFGRVTIANCAANSLIRSSVAFNQTFDVLGVEGCQGLDWTPSIFNIAIGTFNVQTMRVTDYKLLSTSTPAAGGTASMIRTYQGGAVNIGMLTIAISATGLTDIPWNIAGNEGESSGDYQVEANIGVLKLEDGGGTRRGGFHIDNNMPQAAFPMPGDVTARNYRYGKTVSRIEPRFRIDADLNVYAQYEDGFFELPANPGAARTVKFFKTSRPSGTGTNIAPKDGTKHIVRRRAGTANGNGIIIKNSADATLATLTASGSEAIVQYSAASGDWVLR